MILGQLGDRLGRKEVLAFTLMMMALATFGIGALPSGYVIGIWAPILLICLKVVQGFSTGGEYAGATTFVTEYAPDKRRGFYAATLDWGSYMGNALGAGFVTALTLTLPADVMETWGVADALPHRPAHGRHRPLSANPYRGHARLPRCAGRER